MHTKNGKKNPGTTDSQWFFLGEFPLDELMVAMDDRELTNTGLIFHTIRGMGIQPELHRNIDSKLVGFAKETMAHLNQGTSQSTVYIRLFCQIQMVEEVSSAKSSRQFTSELAIESNQIIHLSDVGINGGWGYFLVKRGGGFPPASSLRTCNWIDLYLYKEGE